LSGCRECITQSGGCCEFIFGDGWKIPVFPEELKRISRFTGQDIASMMNTDPLSRSQRQWYARQKTDPLWNKLFLVWSHPTGFTKTCPFLRPDGCALPYQEKPFVCQAFPLDFNITEGKVFLGKDLDCPLGDNARSPEEIVTCFDDDWDSFMSRFNEFRQNFLTLLGELQAGK